VESQAATGVPFELTRGRERRRFFSSSTFFGRAAGGGGGAGTGFGAGLATALGAGAGVAGFAFGRSFSTAFSTFFATALIRAAGLTGFLEAGFPLVRAAGFFATGFRAAATGFLLEAAFFPCTFAIDIPLPTGAEKMNGAI